MCWKWLILSGSVRLNTEPTGLAASASLICPSESSVSCSSFSSSVMRLTSAFTRCSVARSAGRLVGCSAASSSDLVAAITPPAPETPTPSTTAPMATRRLLATMELPSLSRTQRKIRATAPGRFPGAVRNQTAPTGSGSDRVPLLTAKQRPSTGGTYAGQAPHHRAAGGLALAAARRARRGARPRPRRPPRVRQAHVVLLRRHDRPGLGVARGHPQQRRVHQRADVDNEHRRLHVERRRRP